MSTPITSTVSASRSMGVTVRPRTMPFTRRLAPSPSIRLAQVYQVRRPKTALELYQLSCRRVALGNEVYLDFEQPEVVIQAMAVIDASLANREILPLRTALHQAELADAAEQLADESFRHRVEEGTATVEDAREFIRKSAIARNKAEQAERAAQQWVDEQEAR